MVWCSTLKAVYRVVRGTAGVRFERVTLPLGPASLVVTFMAARDGSLWVATKEGIYGRFTDGRVAHAGRRDSLPHETVTSLAEDRQGRALRHSGCERVTITLAIAAAGRRSARWKKRSGGAVRTRRMSSSLTSGCPGCCATREVPAWLSPVSPVSPQLTLTPRPRPAHYRRIPSRLKRSVAV